MTSYMICDDVTITSFCRLNFRVNGENETAKVWRKIDKYMTYVEDWFQTQEKRLSRRFLENLKMTRRVYLAADDEDLLQLLSDK